MDATIPVTTQQSQQILMDTSDIVGYDVNWNGIQLEGFITMMRDMLQIQYEPSDYTDLYIDNCIVNFLNAYYTYCENNGLTNQFEEIDRLIDYVTNDWSNEDYNVDNDEHYNDANHPLADYQEDAYDGDYDDNESIRTMSVDEGFSICSNVENDPFIIE